MKAKVLIPFTDKNTGKTHNKGEIIEVTAARFNEITRKGRFVEAHDETTVEKAESK